MYHSLLYKCYLLLLLKQPHSSPSFSLITHAFSQPLSLSTLFPSVLHVFLTFCAQCLWEVSLLHLYLPKITARCDDFHTALNKDSNLVSSRFLFVPETRIKSRKFKPLFSSWATGRLTASESKWKYLCKLLRLSASLKGTVIYLNLTKKSFCWNCATRHPTWEGSLDYLHTCK